MKESAVLIFLLSMLFLTVFLLSVFGVYTFTNYLDMLYPEEAISFSIGALVGAGFVGFGIGIIIGVIVMYASFYFKNKNKHNKNNDVCTI